MHASPPVTTLAFAEATAGTFAMEAGLPTDALGARRLVGEVGLRTYEGVSQRIYSPTSTIDITLTNSPPCRVCVAFKRTAPLDAAASSAPSSPRGNRWP